jgi:hypothetical protein
MFQNESMTIANDGAGCETGPAPAPALPQASWRRLQALPLALAIVGGALLGGLGLSAIDVFATWSVETRLREATEQTALRLAPRIETAGLHDLQVDAERHLLELAASWPEPMPEVSVTVIGSTLRVRALTWVGTRVLSWIEGADVAIDVSATATIPRPRHFLT